MSGLPFFQALINAYHKEHIYNKKIRFKADICLFLIPLTLVFVGCSGGSMQENTPNYGVVRSIPDAEWQKLSSKKIYFAHQSVGFNILNGIEKIIGENPQIKLNIVRTSQSDDFNKGVLAHSTVGENGKPQTKVDAFLANISNGIGDKANAAALKFCYLDFNGSTDVQEVFTGYKTAIEKIRQEYPDLKIIHITVPLLKIQIGPRAWVKRIIGRPVTGTDDNIKRLEYNELLAAEYGNKDPIFDLSKIESTYPDGTREIFKKHGKTYYALAPEYTIDGGHLNEKGKRIVSEQFLIFLVTHL
jgi:hypothetical protein